MSSFQRLSVIKGSSDDLESLRSSIVESSILDTSCASETDDENLNDLDESQNYKNILDLSSHKQILNSDSIRNQLEKITPLANYSNFSISNSSNVVLGNVIKIKGVLNVNIFENQNKNEEKPMHKNVEEHQQKESPNDNNSPECLFIPRICWLALDPLGDYKYLEEPVDYVIISHTATDSSTSTARNMEIIRNIQTFHIDSQGWEDIGYNFLIGCDGKVYEGRGWGVAGAHTFGYNSRSIGISFIGCFMRSLPTDQALNACKNLLIRGINEGHLTNEFKLLGHRQCINTVSPGRILYEEITKWKHFCNTAVDEG